MREMVFLPWTTSDDAARYEVEAARPKLETGTVIYYLTFATLSFPYLFVSTFNANTLSTRNEHGDE
jgi:hypothetical protein